ncbi:MAG: hypothetical protein MI919_15950 [Holophagales bacterium]|nr:hypothetical protein [Holophagales bacterium]
MNRPDPPVSWRRTAEPPLVSLEHLLSYPDIEPPRARALTLLFLRLEDAVEGSLPSLRGLAWLTRQSPTALDACSVLRFLGLACGQAHSAAGEVGLRIDYASAVEALRIVRAVIAGEDPATDPDAWAARVDAYGLAVYGEARGWVDRPGLSRELAEVVPAELGIERKRLLEGVARCATAAAEDHDRLGIGRDLWEILEMDAETLASLARRWAESGPSSSPPDPRSSTEHGPSMMRADQGS